MRRFSDAEGRTWDVVAGRESWGAIVALFVPKGRPDPGNRSEGPEEDPPIRQAPLDASGYGEATSRLEAMSVEDLRTLLDRSVPKDNG